MFNGPTAPLNGIEHGNAHSAIGDVIATIGIAKLISKKAPNVWKASQFTTQKDQTMEIIKKEKLFCSNEYFYIGAHEWVSLHRHWDEEDASDPSSPQNG